MKYIYSKLNSIINVILQKKNVPIIVPTLIMDMFQNQVFRGWNFSVYSNSILKKQKIKNVYVRKDF